MRKKKEKKWKWCTRWILLPLPAVRRNPKNLIFLHLHDAWYISFFRCASSRIQQLKWWHFQTKNPSKLFEKMNHDNHFNPTIYEINGTTSNSIFDTTSRVSSLPPEALPASPPSSLPPSHPPPPSSLDNISPIHPMTRKWRHFHIIFCVIFASFLTSFLTSFWRHLGVISDIILTSFLTSFWRHSDIILASFWRHFCVISDIIWRHFGVIYDIILASFMISFWRHFGVILASWCPVKGDGSRQQQIWKMMIINDTDDNWFNEQYAAVCFLLPLCSSRWRCKSSISTRMLQHESFVTTKSAPVRVRVCVTVCVCVCVCVSMCNSHLSIWLDLMPSFLSPSPSPTLSLSLSFIIIHRISLLLARRKKQTNKKKLNPFFLFISETIIRPQEMK